MENEELKEAWKGGGLQYATIELLENNSAVDADSIPRLE